MSSDYVKPRPAVIVQSDDVTGFSKTVLLMTSNLLEAGFMRILVEPSATNRLRKPTHVMVDKAMTFRAHKVGPVFGTLDPETMTRINRAIALFFGLG
jgi:mRNA interferase MazF